MFDQISLRRLDPSMAAMCLFALFAFVDSIFNYFWRGNGIHGSEGALLVVVSTLLMLGAASFLAWRRPGGAIATILHVLLALDFLGTGFAAYLLEAWILLAIDVLAALAWLACIVSRRPAPITGAA